MFNKIFTVIHNKYSRFFRFIFYLRYLFSIFLVSLAAFLIIPNYFNYEKRSEIIKKDIFERYNLRIDKFEKIQFHSFPIPRLKIDNAVINIGNTPITINVQNLIINPKLFSIYNYENFQTNKIILKNNRLILKTINSKDFIKNILSQKNKFIFDNLNLQIIDNNESILNIDKVNFANYGYRKNLINGEIFGKKFKIKTKNNLKNLKFKLIKSGISADMILDDNTNTKLIRGTLKSKILSTNLKFNFDYDFKTLIIYNSFLRNSYLSFKNKGLITLSPFLDFNLKFQVEEINEKLFKKIDLNKFLDAKYILKRINAKNEVIFISKRFNRSLVEKLNLKIEMAYGTVNYTKKMKIMNYLFDCKGDINFLEEYPMLFFNCLIFLDEKSNIFEAKVIGSLNILNNKVNFKKISSTKDYKASKEDLSFFKNAFENILFNENFLKIFDRGKIKKFIAEIS